MCTRSSGNYNNSCLMNEINHDDMCYSCQEEYVDTYSKKNSLSLFDEFESNGFTVFTPSVHKASNKKSKKRFGINC